MDTFREARPHHFNGGASRHCRQDHPELRPESGRKPACGRSNPSGRPGALAWFGKHANCQGASRDAHPARPSLVNVENPSGSVFGFLRGRAKLTAIAVTTDAAGKFGQDLGSAGGPDERSIRRSLVENENETVSPGRAFPLTFTPRTVLQCPSRTQPTLRWRGRAIQVDSAIDRVSLSSEIDRGQPAVDSSFKTDVESIPASPPPAGSLAGGGPAERTSSGDSKNNPAPPPAQKPFADSAEQLLDRTAQPFASIDLEGRFVWINRAFEQLTGYSAAELARLKLEDITPAKWHGSGRSILKEIRSTGISARYEKEYRRKDGTIVTVEVLADLDSRRAGPAGRLHGVHHRHRRAQAGRERPAGLGGTVPPALRRGPRGLPRDRHRGADRQHQQDRVRDARLHAARRSIGRPVFDFVAPEFREQAQAAFPEKVRGRPAAAHHRADVRRRGTGGGSSVAIEERYNRDDQGEIVGIRSTVQDITDRKRTEAALVASERRARVLFEGIEDAVFVHSPDGRILDANPAAGRLLGYSRDETARR